MLVAGLRATPAGREGNGIVSPEPETKALRVELLGGFRVACGDAEILDDGWRLAKARSLVKIVALAPGLSIHREQLIDYLWPELDSSAGTNNLHQALHVARRTLASVLPDVKPNEILRLQHGILTLSPPVPVWVDVDAFEAAASTLRGSTDAAALYAALDLYQGELLPDDLYEDWASERRVALQEHYLSALDRLARLHYARREAAPAIDVLRRVVATEPDQEDAHRTLMELYALTGRRQQALRQYERLREILARELDVEPDSETERLYEAIQAGEFPDEVWEEALPEGRLSAAAAPSAPREPPRPAPAPAEEIHDFVGREPELTRLTAAFRRTVGGRGEIALIAGEPGIGKTRMIEEFTGFVASQGVEILWGSAYEGDGAPAYWPWVQIVRGYIEGRPVSELQAVMGPGAADIARIVPELRRKLPDLEVPPPLDPDGERFRLFDSMTNSLQAASGKAPVILILDDLQWADRSSLALLEFLAREISQSRLLVIAAYRHVEVERGHPLLHTLGELARHERSERITLSGLDAGQISRYLAFATGRDAPEGLAEAIHEQTDGNPFFVREITRLLIDEQRLDRPEDVRSWRLTIPPGIRETIALRTDHLSDVAHRTLTIASVSGRDFELPVVARVANLDEMDALDALEEVLHTGLIEESDEQPGAFRFVHAIVRETLYDAISQVRRLRMHLRTGEVIEQVYAATLEGRLTELAHHFFVAAALDEARRAVGYLRRAGQRSMEQIAPSEAAVLFERALVLLERNEDSDRVQLCETLIDYGLAQSYTGDTLAARQTFSRAADVARDLDAPDLFARAALGFERAGLYTEVADDAAARLLEEALALRPDGDSTTTVELLSHLSEVESHRAAANKQRSTRSARAVAMARRLADPTALGTALLSSLQANWHTLSFNDRLDISAEILQCANQANDQQFMLQTRTWRLTALLEAGEIDEADRELESYLQLADMLRQPQNRWAGLTRLTMRALMDGRFDDAAELTRQARELGARSAPGPSRLTDFTHRFLIALEQGNLAELESESVVITSEYPFPLLSCLRAVLLVELGHRAQAWEQFASLMAHAFDDGPGNMHWLPTLAMLSELAYLFSASDDADVLSSALSGYRSHNVFGGNSFCFGAVDYYLGLMALVQNRFDQARSYLGEAVRLNEKMRAWPFVAYTECALAQSLWRDRGCQELEAANVHLSRARNLAQQMGMVRLLQRIESLAEQAPALNSRVIS